MNARVIAEVSSPKYPSLRMPEEINDMATLRTGDPGMYRAVQDVIAGLKEDMIPAEVQHSILAAMTPGMQRELVARISGLDASVLMTFKQQLQLIDTVLRRVLNPDGTKNSAGAELDVSVKEAMNMSLKVTQVLTRDLPKIYTLERVQKQERALLLFMERHMDRKQQEKYLELLQDIEKELDAE